ncbi:FAD linked oxidase, N-terminal [Parasponia andersonii]|uniref:FAD linked oxidase, N-terminal n=1 Tax=Parasponia andersonii TaxID=3476 RepID=A0A2P5BNE8_PARAD|nr:FAD linked oxidase, N-terminal [Parasponia andersonii]
MTLVCRKRSGLQLRIESGGHDYEGLSYTTSASPFLVLSPGNLRTIVVDLEKNTTWVEAGATIGELYYKIVEKSPVHGFPAGVCPMLRKYGLAADQIWKARIVDANGRVLDRKSMATVSVFSLEKRLDKDSTKLVHKWQYVSPMFDENLYVRVIVESSQDELVNRIGNDVSRLKPKDSPLEVLINRTPQPKSFFRTKSDYVKEPTSVNVMEELWKWCLEVERVALTMTPYGGKVNEI